MGGCTGLPLLTLLLLLWGQRSLGFSCPEGESPAAKGVPGAGGREQPEPPPLLQETLRQVGWLWRAALQPCSVCSIPAGAYLGANGKCFPCKTCEGKWSPGYVPGESLGKMGGEGSAFIPARVKRC